MSRIIPMFDIIARFFDKKRAVPFHQRRYSYTPCKSKGLLIKIKDLSLSVSRVLSCTVIYLGLSSPISSSDIHGKSSDGQPYWRLPNLAASGVYMAYLVTKISVSSYLAFPSLPQTGKLIRAVQNPKVKPFAAVYFCCTILEVAFTWRYQAPCPMLLGLSSLLISTATV